MKKMMFYCALLLSSLMGLPLLVMLFSYVVALKVAIVIPSILFGLYIIGIIVALVLSIIEINKEEPKEEE